jgi:hypothetical protein
MGAYSNQALNESQFVQLTESELANLRSDQGMRVVKAHGLYWWHRSGFFRRTHFLAECSRNDLARPRLLCWGYHTVLRAEDAHLANCSTALHIIQDASTYDESCIDETKRKQIRRCTREMTVVRVTDPLLLIDQGWKAFSAAAKRIDRWEDVTREKYLSQVERWVSDPRRFIVAAVRGDQLLGYLENVVVNDVAYLEEVFVPDEYIPLNISTYLHFETARFFGQSGRISRICAGPHLSERAGLAEFKRRMGFELVLAPSYVWTMPLAASVLRRLRPHGYYRLTGRHPVDLA